MFVGKVKPEESTGTIYNSSITAEVTKCIGDIEEQSPFIRTDPENNVRNNPSLPDNASESTKKSYANCKCFGIILAVIVVATMIAAITAAIMHHLQTPKTLQHEVSEAVPQQCSLPCTQLLSNITTDNGHLSCSSEVVRLQCDTGSLPATVGRINCSSGPTAMASLKCLQQICPAPSQPDHGQVLCDTAHTVGSSCKVTCKHKATTGEVSRQLTCLKNLTWSPLPTCLPPSCGSPAECQRQVMMIAGGELAGQTVDLVRPYPSSFAVYTSCLPHLPHRLKWGSMGFVEGSLIVCGGENTTESQSRACWILDKRTHTWMEH